MDDRLNGNFAWSDNLFRPQVRFPFGLISVIHVIVDSGHCGSDAATLGHSHADTTLIYAEHPERVALAVAEKFG